MPRPKSLGARIDALYRLRDRRLKLSKQVDAMKAQEREASAEIAADMRGEGVEKTSGKLATFSPGVRVVPQVHDWQKLHAHIKKTGQWELLQRRMNDGAFRERVEAGKKVPGVEAETIVTYSLTKAGKR